MSYFELSKPMTGLALYPFDFHNHFSGILPVEGDVIWEPNDIELPCYENNGKDMNHPAKVTIKPNQELSLIGLMIPDASWDKINSTPEKDKQTKLLAKAKRKAHYDLFRLALTLIEQNNPFWEGAFLGDRLPEYRRGECAAENIYIACCLLLGKTRDGTTHRIDQPLIYQSVRKMLADPDYLQNNDDRAYPIIAYFNRKIFSANKYTPFDDAYWARDAVRDFAEEYIKQKFNYASLCYLYMSGISHVQIATSPGSIPRLDACINAFAENRKGSISYKLLAHSPEVYASEEVFSKALGNITGLFDKDLGQARYKNLVGIDLLSAETKTGLYKTFFDHLLKESSRSTFREYRTPAPHYTLPCKKITIHIHCGEGSGVASNSRSLCGYYLYNAVNPDTGKFCKLLSAYARKCYNSTLQHHSDRRRERKNLDRPEKDFGEVSNLFDELFFRNKLSVDGLPLQRFDITSAISQNAVAYNAKTNSMHLCETLRSPKNDNNYYHALCEVPTNLYSFRIGHAYYNRNYMAGEFPQLCFDTNLGSNFITGASGLFNSAQIYRLNRGFRHLDGQISTHVLERTLEATAYCGENRLNPEQMTVTKSSNKPKWDIIKKFFGCLENSQTAATAVEGFFEDIWPDGTDPVHISFRTSLLSIAVNWRSYLFGSDAQGVEHSEVAKEALRMAVMLAYVMQGVEKGNFKALWITKLSSLFSELSKAYWEETVGDPKGDISRKRHKIEHLNGFNGPNSALWIKTSLAG